MLGRLARAVAGEAHDRHDGEFALDLRQAALVRDQEGGRAIDGLGQQFLVDRLALCIERARPDALGGRKLILLDQCTDALPH